MPFYFYFPYCLILTWLNTIFKKFSILFEVVYVFKIVTLKVRVYFSAILRVLKMKICFIVNCCFRRTQFSRETINDNKYLHKLHYVQGKFSITTYSVLTLSIWLTRNFYYYSFLKWEN